MGMDAPVLASRTEAVNDYDRAQTPARSAIQLAEYSRLPLAMSQNLTSAPELSFRAVSRSSGRSHFTRSEQFSAKANNV
jgi:hypothetical protein